MKTDGLFEIIKAEIHRKDVPEQTASELIQSVVATYLQTSLSNAFTPSHLWEEVKSEVEAHTLEIYRKITYGYNSLEEFRVKRLKHPPKILSSYRSGTNK